MQSCLRFGSKRHVRVHLCLCDQQEAPIFWSRVIAFELIPHFACLRADAISAELAGQRPTFGHHTFDRPPSTKRIDSPTFRARAREKLISICRLFNAPAQASAADPLHLAQRRGLGMAIRWLAGILQRGFNLNHLLNIHSRIATGARA